MPDQPNLFDAPILEGTDKLRVFRERALVCRKCMLCETRTQVVYGTGNAENPDIAFVGEAPGQNEDKQGVPFIGAAGELLTRMIEALGMKREQVYIANSVNCRPPQNRKPIPEEMAACREHLIGQLRTIVPKTIVLLGATAATQLLRSKNPAVGEMRGRWYTWEEVPVRVTYHPAYLLRDKTKKVDVWEDLQAVKQKLDSLASIASYAAAPKE